MDSLLEKSRVRNLIYGVTGMLLYDYGVFLQVLEGHRINVELVFESIQRDRRHTGVQVIESRDIDARLFASWTMAYADLSLGIASPPGYGPGIPSRLTSATVQSYFSFYRARLPANEPFGGAAGATP